MNGVLVLVIVALIFELVINRSEHRQMSGVHALRRNAISLEKTLQKSGLHLGKRRHSRHITGLS